MSYSPLNPPKLIGYQYAKGTYGGDIPGLFLQFTNLTSPRLWEYFSQDTVNELITAPNGYFSGALALGMSPGDLVICYDTNTVSRGVFVVEVSNIDAVGSAAVIVNNTTVSTRNQVLLQSGIPMVLPSSGTMGANGALSAITALPYAYSICYMYFPAGAVFSGSAAGWYFTKMSSVTAGTVYNNVYSSGTPRVPATLVGIIAAGPGAYTQITGSAVVATSLVVAGGTMGVSGKLKLEKLGSTINNVNTKSIETYLAGSNLSSYSLTTSVAYRFVDEIMNLGVANNNVGNYFTSFGGSSTDWKRTTVDTSVDQLLTATMRINVATDFVIMESLTVLAYYGN